MRKLFSILIALLFVSSFAFGQQQAEEKYQVKVGYQYGAYTYDSTGVENAIADLLALGVNTDTIGVIYIAPPGIDTSGITDTNAVQLIGFVDGAYISAPYISSTLTATAGAVSFDGLATNITVSAASPVAVTSVTNLKANTMYKIMYSGSNAVTFNDGNNLKLTGNLALNATSDILLLWSDGTNLYEVAFTSND